MKLSWPRRAAFTPFFLTQFSGVFNDNFYKSALVILITYKNISLMGLPAASVVAMAGGVFILPFFLFSAYAGVLADRYSKVKIARATKVSELLVMLLGCLGLFIESYELLMVVLFLMGAQSAFFGPVKYGLIPSILDKDQLVMGNALVSGGTFIGILLGTILGGEASSVDNSLNIIAIGVIVIAVLGIIASRKMPLDPAPSGERPPLKVFKSFKDNWRMTKANKPVLWVIFGMSWFWFLGSCVLSMLPVFVKDILGGNEQMATYFLGIFTVGMGIGSLLCSRLSKRQAEVGMIPLSLLVMSICLIDFFFVGADFSKPFTGVLYGISEFYQYEHSIRVSLDLLGLSVAGGTFMIPQMTTLQIKSPESQVSSFVASNNIWNAVFMVVGAVFLMGLYAFGLVVFEAFLVLGILNIMVAIVLHFHYSESSWRFLVQIATGFCYKVVPKNEHHIPSEGPFLVVANHTSYVDWAILMAVSPRPLRFVIDHKFYYVPVVQWFLKQVRLIPIATKKESEQILNQAFETIDQSLEDGHVLCIFPEGWITRNGDMRRFQPGVNKILNRKPVPIVPVVIKGLWGSFFSYSGAGVLKGLPNPLRRKVHIEFLEPISAESFDRESLQSTMSELYSDKT